MDLMIRDKKAAPPVCYTIKYLTLNLHYTITFKSAPGSVRSAESGQRNKRKVGQREEWGGGSSPDQTMVDGDERLE